MTVKIGSAAPAFKLKNQDEKPVALADYKGKKVIVYFYPAAATPGCTTQACDFRDNINSLKSAGYVVLGISPDEPAKLKKFKDKEKLNFELLSDPENKIQQKYGAYGEKSMYGKTYMAPFARPLWSIRTASWSTPFITSRQRATSSSCASSWGSSP